MDTAEFDYPLPPERIAQHPLAERDASRLLVDRGPDQRPDDRHVRDLPDLLEPGDLVVVNRTRVLPARLAVRRHSGGAAEVLLLEDRGGGAWEVLARPSRKLRPGEVLHGEALQVVMGEDLGQGRRSVCLRPKAGLTTLEAIERSGQVPLPPYIEGPIDDPERYQTVFSGATVPTSVAAPTAGLHFTRALGERLVARGVDVVAVELAVGLGTFRPIAVDRVEDHTMHGEWYRVEPHVWDRIEAARRVVAIGTTTVRTLETVARTSELEGRTDLFIHGGFEFEVVDRLLTNFHQPRSSLLVMIDAFAGPRWRDLYDHALAGDYRFLSFGDAMLLTRHDRWPDA